MNADPGKPVARAGEAPGYAGAVGDLNFAELLLGLVALQQLVAAAIWLLAVRLRVAPRVPSLHWVGASVWVAVCAALPLTTTALGDWYGFGLPALLLPGSFILARIGLEILFRAPRHDAEHLMVVVLALAGAGLGALAQAPPAWTHICASILCAYSLLRCGACVQVPVRLELGGNAVGLVLWPLRLMAALFVLRALGALLCPGLFAQLISADTPSNIALLMAYMSVGVVFQVMLALIVALRLVARLQILSRIDPLTGLCNRRGLEERWGQLGRKLPFAVLAVDVDHFKRVNDAHGHATGDLALQHLAELMRRCVRPGDTVVRLGGEEFLLLLPQTDHAQARQRAEQLRELVACSPLRLDGLKLALSVSIGIAVTDRAVPAARLVAMADRALYRAKREGRNRVAFSESLQGRP